MGDPDSKLPRSWYPILPSAILPDMAFFLSLLLLLPVVMSGCATTSVVPDALQPQIDRTGTFPTVWESPDAYRGKVVVWGGEVLKTKALQGGTQFEVLQLPLDEGDAPTAQRTASRGRFFAWQREFLDPATVTDGTRVTIVGEVTGAAVDKLDEADYRYPTLEVIHLHRWEPNQLDEQRIPGPYWGVFGGFGIGGGGGIRSGEGIGIGF
ncbi:MAG: hypothetical protein NBKEAIPA_01645 [Nitrospirae bacterium]|nr:hypothetical protein [Nitrospirota bacterium]MCE7966988.1 hypothetical protein [Nitrospira sp. NTP2]RIK56641.1 MAG: hypothetical protein DCC63_16720 [Nitrospira sp.]